MNSLRYPSLVYFDVSDVVFPIIINVVFPLADRNTTSGFSEYPQYLLIKTGIRVHGVCAGVVNLSRHSKFGSVLTPCRPKTLPMYSGRWSFESVLHIGRFVELLGAEDLL